MNTDVHGFRALRFAPIRHAFVENFDKGARCWPPYAQGGKGDVTVRQFCSETP